MESFNDPTCSRGLMMLPNELFEHVDRNLSVEESRCFKKSHPRIAYALRGNFQNYDKMHVSDDSSECLISDTRGRSVARKFEANNAPEMLRMLPNLREITVIMKEVNMRGRLTQQPARRFTDCSPYSPGGYLVKLLGEISPAELTLRQLSLHVDIMVESLQDVFLQCPTEDLKFAMDHLVNAPFNSFIQISICSAQIRPSDEMARNYLLHGMQYALKQAAEIGAKTEFVVEPCEGYVDMTIEKGRVEYSFAFFYYNPTICEPMTGEVAMQITNV